MYINFDVLVGEVVKQVHVIETYGEKVGLCHIQFTNIGEFDCSKHRFFI